MKYTPVTTSIVPWISVHNGLEALTFYKAAFGAVEAYRLDMPDGALVARLSVDGAEFWVSGGAATDSSPVVPPADPPVRMILTVTNPDALFDRAVGAGATVLFPVGEQHGWRLGRMADPFGHHWEIGRPV